ncbi:MAG: RagB/SusD family nutrient uptake outer membrane protein [Prevotella sp.]|jgi:hypothetical protein|nr:RagB/SusD family nutrient uptake outer membrane protein [Prevotella sp.]
MKTIVVKLSLALFFIYSLVGFAGCGADFLEPKPLSFFSPNNVFHDAEGFMSVIRACDEKVRSEFYTNGDRSFFADEYIYSDVAVEGLSDQASCIQDIIQKITPSAALNIENCRIGWFWQSAYQRIKYTNVVLSRIDDVELSDEKEKNKIKGMAYFHRAYAYYRLVNLFGDVPFLGQELTEPKVDYASTKRDVILRKMKKDMELAVQWCTDGMDRGDVTKGACLHLLTKINLALGEFDDAISSASALIDGGVYSLMTEPFGSIPEEEGPFLRDLGVVRDDVVSQLHWQENKAIAENKEVLYMAVSREDLTGSRVNTYSMRLCLPWWSRTAANQLYTPDGKRGMSDGADNEFDLVKTFGRGIGRVRGTKYHTQDIWDDANDLRHKKYNWMEMEYMVYNNPDIKEDSPYYGQPLRKFNDDGSVLTSDSINCWYGWPHYKLYTLDPRTPQARGGAADWYIFRLAETYLLRAEAYWWKNQLSEAMSDVNAVRTRAKCLPYTNTAGFNIGTILDERARELFYEEPRRTELTRIAFIFAKTGKEFNGQSYSLNNIGTKNFYFDWVNEKNDFYNKGIKSNSGQFYTLGTWHILWPVPQTTISANTKGIINQNYGYAGYENNIEPLGEIPPEEDN